MSAPDNRWQADGRAGYSGGMNTLPPIAEMERAYLSRDAAYNGLFFVGVRTTGIFCRPTCPARSPNPENVEYFPTAAEALFAGYRPCKRCRPMAADDQPEWATCPAGGSREQPVGTDHGGRPAGARDRSGDGPPSLPAPVRHDVPGVHAEPGGCRAR